MTRKFFTVIIILFIQFLTLTTLSHEMYSEVKDPFFNSISRGNNTYFNQLLESEKGKVKRLNEALIYASRDGRPKMVIKLLAAGAKINYETCGWTPLMYAIIKERASVVRQLSAQGVADLTETQSDRLSLYHREWHKKIDHL